MWWSWEKIDLDVESVEKEMVDQEVVNPDQSRVVVCHLYHHQLRFERSASR